MTVDPYTDPTTGLLRNRLGITDADRLREAEAGLSLAALAELAFRIIPGSYDLEHLCAFHREIFGDIYPWAGEIRVVGIAKSDPFCLPQHIETYSAEVFDSLAKERFLRGLKRDAFVDRITISRRSTQSTRFARATEGRSAPSSDSWRRRRAGRSTGPR